MSPLRIERSEGIHTQLSDDENLSLSQWAHYLGVAMGTVKRAFGRMGRQPHVGPLIHPDIPRAQCFPVRLFPELIRGLQMATDRSDGLVYNIWAYDIDPDADRVRGKLANGDVFEFWRDANTLGDTDP